MLTLVNKGIFPGEINSTLIPQNISLKGLGGHEITRQLYKNIPCQIGSQSYSIDMCAFDMADSITLGLDFLEAHHCVSDLMRNVLEIDKETVTANVKNIQGEQIKVSRVTVQSRSIIPANSVGFVSRTLETDFEVESFESSNFLCSSVLGKGDTLKLKVVNGSNKSVKFKVGQDIGNAESVEVVSNKTVSKPVINKVSIDKSTHTNLALPIHVQDFFDRSSVGLNQEQVKMLGFFLLQTTRIFRHFLQG